VKASRWHAFRACGRSRTCAATTHTLVVRGIYDAPRTKPLLYDVSVAAATFDADFPSPKNA
jgi:hypothetical protein